MKKFYTFTAGQKVPQWMMDFTCADVDMNSNKHGKIVFGRSVVAVREPGHYTKLMPASGGDCFISIKGLVRSCIGGVLGATGVEINEHDEAMFGRGLVYSK